ncbi:MAG: hypothetical protein V3U54_05350 [Thermodesulfobacteriota bacterium]
MFKKLIPIMLAVFILPFFIETSYGYGSGEKLKTFSGILVDTKCYGMNNDNFTNDHMTPKGNMPGCAAMCAKMGIPVGYWLTGKKAERSMS